ncbi:cytochrome c-type biogenesis protein [Limoniibacter endophyticus]|uniref:Cytochrome c-type biogenesis protein n=1 Tax=Limoniibacter endophyticus TaxID=1565040 RepID=A0A8J3GH60_9HYPH|nr:cytochrome c-type biogenesis protein [Limoniibacter endophyticus]GHC69250.1 cytochrome c biogenesis protein [Limoniibacter endophyticus]
MMRRFALSLILIGGLMGATHALTPDEILSDPGLEKRARALSAELRCMVCQNQSIDDSNAELAKDLRAIVRERLVAGDSDDEIKDYVVARYGEFVLLRPRLSMQTIALWASPALIILIAGGGIYLARRNRPTRKATDALSAEEQAKLDNILAERD